MSVFHDEVEIEDFEFDEETEAYYFPCPCGDRFCITKELVVRSCSMGKCQTPRSCRKTVLLAAGGQQEKKSRMTGGSPEAFSS
ncbi:hypothetical protein XENOCAPTIV_004476 [Xenoophorus captivus]|uniref:DPH-type MB domain-containing protein n=1 Tax=Xenoophorus captivus TaxID=1517983 RepID=A0ABV0RFW1_9TELE